MKKISRILLVLFLLSGPSFAEDIRLCILFFNDLHGHLMPFDVEKDGQKESVGGIARIATLVNTLREQNRKEGIKTYVLLARDILQGTPLSTVFKGEADVECLNRLPLTAMVVGNHEFDFGLDNFFSLKSRALFPFLSANVLVKETFEFLCDQTLSITLSPDLSLTVIGATTSELLTTTAPWNSEKISVNAPLKTVKKLFKQYKDKGPVLLLSHCGWKTDVSIAAALPDLLLVIGGHDQILLNPCEMVGTVPVFQAFEKGKFLGRADIVIDPETRKSEVLKWEYLPVNQEISEDPQMKALAESYYSRLDRQFKEVLGEASVTLDGERERIRYEETNLGNYIADTMREFTGADIALINAGSIRSSIMQGAVTLEDIFKMMPYENQLLTLKIKGAELLEALERAVKSTREEEDGGFLHISGLKLLIQGTLLKSAEFDGTPIKKKKDYTLVLTDFMAGGGDGYEIFKNKASSPTGMGLRDCLINNLRKNKILNPRTDGRIVREA